MVAIESSNGYKVGTFRTMISTVPPISVTDTDEFCFPIKTRRIYSPTPVLPISVTDTNVFCFPTESRRIYSSTPPGPPFETGIPGSWKLARTDDNGNIMMPMVLRTAGTRERTDVFGNKVQPTDVALFPDHYTPWYTRDPSSSGGYGPNLCFYIGGSEESEGCPKTAEPSTLSTTWWILPLSSPALALATSTTSSTWKPALLSSAHRGDRYHHSSSPTGARKPGKDTGYEPAGFAHHDSDGFNHRLFADQAI